MHTNNVPDKKKNKNAPRTTKYIVRHDQDSEDDHELLRPCIHFITYGSDYGTPLIQNFHVLISLNLSAHATPPDHLCDRFTGQDPNLAQAFFSIPANEETYRDALAKLRAEIQREMRLGRRGRCIAFAINCTAGRHRSVAMAERLARTVGGWGGFRSECLHLDLGKAADMDSQRAIRVDFTTTTNASSGGGPAQGQKTRSAHAPRTEAPLHKKMVARATREMRRPIAGR